MERWSRPLVNLPNYTPLHLCAVMDWLPIAQLLVHRGADPTTKNRFGQSAASLAARHRAGSVLAFLQQVLPPKVRTRRRRGALSVGMCACVQLWKRKRHNEAYHGV